MVKMDPLVPRAHFKVYTENMLHTYIHTIYINHNLNYEDVTVDEVDQVDQVDEDVLVDEVDEVDQEMK